MENNLSSQQKAPKSFDAISAIMKAIAQQESGGNYGAIGPKTASGDRAYGKYQVMAANIPSWTKQALGRSYTVNEFLKNPAIQDAVARFKMSSSFQQYKNPADVASVWFSGRPVANNMSKDVTGTSVPKYVKNVVSMYNKYRNLPTETIAAPTASQVQVAQMSNENPSKLMYRGKEVSRRVAPGNVFNKALERLGTTSSSQSSISGPQSSMETPSTSLGTVTTRFGDSTRYEASHPAIDIANKIGTKIPSFVEGKVIAEETGRKQGDAGFGNNITIQDSSGNKHRFSHLNSEWVKVGDTVKKGQLIGEMGNSGSTYSTSGGTGSHLDYRVRDAYGKYINPNIFLNQKKPI